MVREHAFVPQFEIVGDPDDHDRVEVILNGRLFFRGPFYIATRVAEKAMERRRNKVRVVPVQEKSEGV